MKQKQYYNKLNKDFKEKKLDTEVFIWNFRLDFSNPLVFAILLLRNQVDETVLSFMKLDLET